MLRIVEDECRIPPAGAIQPARLNYLVQTGNMADPPGIVFRQNEQDVICHVFVVRFIRSGILRRAQTNGFPLSPVSIFCPRVAKIIKFTGQNRQM
jgi:hypothetical protein